MKHTEKMLSKLSIYYSTCDYVFASSEMYELNDLA